MNPREFLANLYLEYLNDFLTTGRFAEYHGIPHMHMLLMLELGLQYHNERTNGVS